MEYKKQYKWLIVTCLTLLHVPYFYISKYCNPVADDLICAYQAKNTDLLKLLIRQYQSWGGRYTSNIFIFITPIAFDSFTVYKVIPVLLLFLTLFSLFFFIAAISKNQLDAAEKLILTLLFSLLFLHQMPILSEGIYWYTGAVTYQLANCVTIIYISCLACFAQGRIIFKSRSLHLGLLTLLLITCIGFNEIHMIALIAFAFISLWIVRKNKLQYTPVFIYLLIITLIFSTIMYLAPGNDARAGVAINNHRFIPAVLFSLAQTLRFFMEWVSSVPLLISSLLYFYLNKKLSERIQLFSSSFYLSTYHSCGLLFFVIFIAAFPPYWATGILGQHRTLNVAYCLFLFVWFINLTVCFNRYANELKAIKPLSLQFRGALVMIAIVSLFFTKNGYDALLDIFYGKARSYDQQMTERYKLMQGNAATIYFYPIVNPPQTLFINDITDDPEYWLNRAYTLYFGCKNKVLLRK